MRVADDTITRDSAEVSAIEAIACWAEYEHVAYVKLHAAPPGRQNATMSVVDVCLGSVATADKDASPKSADAITADGGDRLQEISRTWKVSAFVRQIGNGR